MAADRILEGLNEAQREAVSHDAGPLLIVAGAGTGKTTVITRRIAHLIAQRRARPEEILALTFTDKAAAEMEERVDTLVPYGYADVEIATFHAFGDRILREHALEIGLTPDFRVFNRAEQVIFLRDRLFELPLDHYRPLGDPTRHLQALITLISRCKDEDVAPEEYGAYAERLAREATLAPDYEEARQRAAQQAELAATYAKYRELTAREGVVDFGDQIVLVLRLLRARPYVLGAYQRRFKYILVDEFQDTNYAQFELVKLLAARHANVAVVADDDQCLPSGTLVETATGPRPIESFKPGDAVLTAAGKGFLGTSVVTRVFRQRKHTRLLTFETESGRRLTVTDNHKMFCYVPRRGPSDELTYVYLMERRDLGWRIGVTNDLAVRLRLEAGADRIVGLRAFRSEAEARYHEVLWSLKYSIPTLPFMPRSDVMIVGNYLEGLFRQLETRKNAEMLAVELGIDLNAHHFALGGVHRGGQSRVKVVLTMCWRRYAPKKGARLLKAPQILHGVSVETSAPGVIERLRAAGLSLRKAKRGWRHRATSTSLREVGIRAELLCELTGGILEVCFDVGRGPVKSKGALVMPAGNVLPGHYVPVVRDNRVVYERVVDVSERVQMQDVYDLEIDRTHNFVAEGIVVHNSIYKFRGAAISNVLGFLEAYPEAAQIVLTDNYRSTQEILDAAYRLIQYNNPDRLEVRSGISKQLTARAGAGRSPAHLHYETASQEADAVAQMIRERVEEGVWRYDDVAVLVRSNGDADQFLRSLNLRGIPWTFSGNAGLYGRPEIRLLIAFLRAVVHVDESVSLHYLASSELYQVPIVDLTRCSTYADRKHVSLFDVLRRVDKIAELRDEVSEEGHAAVGHLVAHLARYMELGREVPTGEVLYQFLKDCGWLGRMYRAETARDIAETNNIAKFFDRIRSASKALRYDNVREFVKHLDALIDAGEDPAVAEADVETPAVHVLTVHKAKGLEFPVVFLVNLVQDKFPSRRRRDALELPVAMIKDTLPSGDFHLQEERRLFYVGMTRAKRELYHTSARDYGGTRQRKVSQFVLEALDLPRDAAHPFKARAVEEIERFAPPAQTGEGTMVPLAPDEELTISHKQIDDYQTCPLKYQYVHVLRVPIRRHHTVAYGSIVHKTVEYYLRRRAVGNYTPLDDLLGAYERAWAGEDILRERPGLNEPAEGFLTREHEEARRAAGRKALTRFWHEEEAAGAKPTHVEKEFGFNLGPDRVRGRFDRVDEDLLGAVIVDYKTGDVVRQKDADRRTVASLQLKIYALAWREMTGTPPQRLELRFVDSNLIGRHTPTEEDIKEAVAAVKAAAAGIRARRFEATPSYNACRFCAYNQICPFTATSE
ncbi:MAG TPA: UvrD-helicase domain-containing protein [Methylomirabilota bacterium]|nr:UvrD-helicase domain-containing protein [Methylomirabilota bacterium]